MRYAPHELSLELLDGEPIRMLIEDESVAFQRQLIRDMCVAGRAGKVPGQGADVVACEDPWLPGVFLTRAELFDQHARLMLVISEVERRSR